MIQIPNTMRPGVFISSSVRAAASGNAVRTVAAVGQAGADAPQGCTVVHTREDAAALGENSALQQMVFALLDAGCAPVRAVPAGEDYAEAFDAIAGIEEVRVVVSDGGGEAFAAHLAECRTAGRERFGVLAVSEPEDAAAIARQLNCERLAVACDGGSCTLRTAAAFAALIAREGAAGCYNGAELPFSGTFDGSLSDGQVGMLLTAGVTPFEQVGGVVECIRAVTSHTLTDGLPDRTFSAVSTVLAVDEVVSGLRYAVRARLRGMKNSSATRESIASQLTVELEARRLEGVIDSFLPPVVAAHPKDPSVCVATLSFSIAPEISQIVISAEISI